jgi:hypothetical protein
MRKLPTGTVSFFFTDIEGSTMLGRSFPTVTAPLFDGSRATVAVAG